MRVTSANFFNATTTSTAYPHLWQWDYGQKLYLYGLSLPGKYDVHFCCVGDSKSIRVTGYKDGVTIPDECLETGRDIFAYVYLHDGDTDGDTEYAILIPVKKRSAPQSKRKNNEIIAEPVGIFDYATALDLFELDWDPSSSRAFKHARCPRGEPVGAFDYVAEFSNYGYEAEGVEGASWDGAAGRPYDHPTPHGNPTGVFYLEDYAEESYNFVTFAGRNAGSGNKLARPVVIFDFAAEQNVMSWDANAKTDDT